jgi:hypothetical protein
LRPTADADAPVLVIQLNVYPRTSSGTPAVENGHEAACRSIWRVLSVWRSHGWGCPSARRLVSLRRARTTPIFTRPHDQQPCGPPYYAQPAAFTPGSGAAWKFSTSDLGANPAARPSIWSRRLNDLKRSFGSAGDDGPCRKKRSSSPSGVGLDRSADELSSIASRCVCMVLRLVLARSCFISRG